MSRIPLHDFNQAVSRGGKRPFRSPPFLELNTFQVNFKRLWRLDFRRLDNASYHHYLLNVGADEFSCAVSSV